MKTIVDTLKMLQRIMLGAAFSTDVAIFGKIQDGVTSKSEILSWSSKIISSLLIWY